MTGAAMAMAIIEPPAAIIAVRSRASLFIRPTNRMAHSGSWCRLKDAAIIIVAARSIFQSAIAVSARLRATMTRRRNVIDISDQENLSGTPGVPMTQ